MEFTIITIKVGLIYAGAAFLLLSLIPIRELINQLQIGMLRSKWIILAALILVFIFSYIFYASQYGFHYDQDKGLEFVVPFIFFFGGLFVFLVGGLALQTARNVKKIAILEQRSVTDALMQINNRRYFDQSIEDEINISKRYKTLLSLIFIDIDKFKNVNDTYGHLVGDEVLRTISKIIKETVRNSDMVCRYGGEEVAIICPNTSLEEALNLSERLRKIVKKSTMWTISDTEEEIKITISLGVSSFGFDNVMCKNNLIKKADNALYKAKDTGRDKVVTLQTMPL